MNETAKMIKSLAEELKEIAEESKKQISKAQEFINIVKKSRRVRRGY
jgi:hypothetical protein